VLLYRDLMHRLDGAGANLTRAQKAAVGDAWSDRDLLEFWRVQHERSKALRIVGVDAKLYSGQSMIDLLIKSAGVKWDRARQAYAANAGAALADAAARAAVRDDEGSEPDRTSDHVAKE
jgi:hypothetical protein